MNAVLTLMGDRICTNPHKDKWYINDYLTKKNCRKDI